MINKPILRKSIFNDIVSFCSQTAVNGTEKREKESNGIQKKKKQYMIKIEIRKKGKKIAQFRLIHSHLWLFIVQNGSKSLL